MRSFLLGKKTEVQSWTNPYVTDGLVAYWDGEWNAGGGKHDATVTVWKDIVGGIEFTAEAGTFPSVSDKSLSFDADDGISSNISTLGILPTSDWTIEVVHNRTESGYNAYIVECMGTTPGAYQFRPRYWGNTLFTAVGTSASVPSASGTYSLSMTWNVGTGNQHHVEDFLAGVQYASGNIYVQAPTKINLGKISNGYFIGEIYGVRIYNRSLTASEIAANYAIDKRRFGL